MAMFKINSSLCSQTVLPNDWKVNYVSEPDIPFLYNEIFVDECYIQHGVTLAEEDVVLDIGANIGLFGMFCAVRCPRGRVVCVEPVPATFQALRQNLASIPHPSSFSSASTSAQTTALQLAVSDGTQAQGEIVFYSGAAGWSTLHPNDAEVREAVEAYVLGALPSGLGLEGETPLIMLGQWLAKLDFPLTNFIIKVIIQATVARMLSQRTRVPCSLRTVSDIIADEGLSVVNLLKVDVERAELEVLQGIQSADWPKIQQVVMEVHDVDGRLNTVCAILKDAGLVLIVCEQSVLMKGTTLWNLYASRQTP
eukprot:CAMPEP_0196573734 /NCGR_PEP_ID=MMETSP1081-20130531/3589_1 /TAXON_ID=36882 /ORGANISM="Pyramimonas amylifera, Strain CCMP720" /LENGTH=308 /DNA_ID=CAMNT_0041891555 /DNA_START=221 /DNA_END=1148 /DNA_ORIENTATION=-